MIETERQSNNGEKWRKYSVHLVSLSATIFSVLSGGAEALVNF